MASPIVTPSDLRTALLADFPVFDTSKNTDLSQVSIDPAMILFWSTVAVKMLNKSRWTADGDPETTVYNLGLEMFVAHNVTLEVLAQRDMDMAGIPGVATGVVATKSAGDVAISYNTQATLDLDAGHWNYTIWGQRFIRMSRMMGAGPIHVNTGQCLDSAGQGGIATIGESWFSGTGAPGDGF